MSHYVLGVIIPDEEETQEWLDQIMDKYNENKKCEPRWEEVPQEEIDRMKEHYKNAITLEELAAQSEDWYGDMGAVIDGKLHIQVTYNENAKWDWYVVGGKWDGHWDGSDEISVHDLIQSDSPELTFALLTPDGAWHEQGEMGWFGVVHNEESDEEWDARFFDIIKNYENNHRLVAVDCHI